jgi:hypothetical protein
MCVASGRPAPRIASVAHLLVKTVVMSVWTAGMSYTPLMTKAPSDGIAGVSSMR